MSSTIVWCVVVSACVLTGCETGDHGRPGEPWAITQEVEDGPSKDELAAAAADGALRWDDDLCELQGWYDDDECDWFCPLPDAACDAPALGPDPAGAVTRYPIILAHGFMSDSGAFAKAAAVLRTDGHLVFAADVPPLAPVDVRAEYLAAWVDHVRSEYGAERVNIIAHSMGGLDARWLVSELGYADAVASVTTLGTPHWGSAVADTALGMVGLIGFIERYYDTDEVDADLEGALLDLTTDEAAFFNEIVRDDPNVHYASWAGVSSKIAKWPAATEDWCGDVLAPPSGWWGWGADLMSKRLAPLSVIAGGINDGVVRVDSATWGDFQGCVPADHLDLMAFSEGPRWITGFDADRFLRNIAFDLAKRGF